MDRLLHFSTRVLKKSSIIGCQLHLEKPFRPHPLVALQSVPACGENELVATDALAARSNVDLTQ